MATHNGCFARIAELEARHDVAVKALMDIVGRLGPDRRGHYPRKAASIGLTIAFDALGKLQSMKTQGLEPEQDTEPFNAADHGTD